MKDQSTPTKQQQRNWLKVLKAMNAGSVVTDLKEKNLIKGVGTIGKNGKAKVTVVKTITVTIELPETRETLVGGIDFSSLPLQPPSHPACSTSMMPIDIVRTNINFAKDIAREFKISPPTLL